MRGSLRGQLTGSSVGKGGIGKWKRVWTCELGYPDDFVLLIEDSSKLQACLDRPNCGVVMFGVRFVPSKCEMLL